MSEDYTHTKSDYDARPKFRRNSIHVDFREASHQKRIINPTMPSAQTVSLNVQRARPKQNRASFDYTQTAFAKNVLIVSNYPALPTKSVLTSCKPDSPTATTSSVITKDEQMGKTS